MGKLFKRLLTMITSLALVFALCIAPVYGAYAAGDDEGTVLIDVDFSDPAVADEFTRGWTTGWEIIDGKFHTTAKWESACLTRPIHGFGEKDIVVSVDFFIAYADYAEREPAICIGVVNNPACIADDDYGASGATMRFYKNWESLYASFAGFSGWMVDSQWKFIQENPEVHTLQMIFRANKTVTVKVDGNILTHSNGDSMSDVDYTDFVDFDTGYIAVKSTNLGNYVDNIKVVAYEPSSDIPDPTGEPNPSGDITNGPDDNNGNGNGEPNGSNVNVKDKSGCGSAISGTAGFALALAAGVGLVISKKRKNK